MRFYEWTVFVNCCLMVLLLSSSTCMMAVNTVFPGITGKKRGYNDIYLVKTPYVHALIDL